MKQGIMILLDPDWEYGKRLAEYFNISDWMPFKTEVFSDSKKMEDYLKDRKPELLVVNETLLKEEFREFPMVILCETLMVAEMDSPQIYKYQSARDIGREIVSWYATQEKRQTILARQEKLTILGVYSLDKKREKNLLAWEAAKYYSKKGKTLYLNLEPFSAMEQYLGDFSGESLSDYLFFLRQNRGNTRIRLQGMTESRAGVDILPPAKAWEDIRDIQMTEWKKLVQVVEMETEYAYLVLDISEAAGDFSFWLSVCERIFMPVGDDFYGRMRKKEMQAFLERRTERELLNKWTVCSSNGWQSFREYTEEGQSEMERMVKKLLSE